RLDTIPGTLPSPGATIAGCPFADRCALADDRCRRELPPLHDLGGRFSRCHYHERAQDLPRQTPAQVKYRAPVPEAVPVLQVRDLNKTFASGDHGLRAVAGVSLEIGAGETRGLVGESGSGKTTFARLLLGLMPPDEAGAILLDAKPLPPTIDERTGDQVKAMQIVFQNPDSA